MTSRRESAVDFTELEDRGNPGEQFEQLIRDLLEADGLTVTFSGRGPDEGRDLIVEEELRGEITGKEKRQWLVWCRNNARSDGAVSEKDLPHNLDLKCLQHGTDGFLLVTTTILTSGAQKLLDGVMMNPKSTCRIKYWVRLDIERFVIEKEAIFERFFPKSFRRYKDRLANPNTITESQLQEIVQGRYGKRLEPGHLRPLLRQTLEWGFSDPEQVREIYEDQQIYEILQRVYRELLGRDLDPSGHFTWGTWLKVHGMDQGQQLVEARIRQMPEYVERQLGLRAQG